MIALTKSQTVELISRGLARETFTHENQGRFDVTAMREMIAQQPNRWKIVDGPLAKETVAFILKEREVCPIRVSELTAQEIDEPAILIDIGDGTHLPIDGHHRMVRRSLDGLTRFRFYEVPLADVPRPNMALYANLPWGEKEMSSGKLRKR